MNLKLKWIWVVLWTAFIVYALLSPSDGIPLFPWMNFKGFDKLVHFVLFAVEGALLIVALNSKRTLLAMAIIVGFCVVFGGALEIAQFYFVEGRSGDFWDLLADMLGASVGAAFVYFLLSKYR